MTQTLFEADPITIPWWKTISSIDSGYIFIAGPTCSGKTTLSNILKTHFEERGIEVTIIRQDDYYKDIKDIPWSYKGYLTDIKDAFYLEEMASDFKEYIAQGFAEIPVYDTNLHRRVSSKTITKKPITIVEGLHVISTFYGTLDSFYIYMDIPTKVCAVLRAEREEKEKHIGIDESICHFIECIEPFYDDEVFSQKKYEGLLIYTP